MLSFLMAWVTAPRSGRFKGVRGEIGIPPDFWVLLVTKVPRRRHSIN